MTDNKIIGLGIDIEDIDRFSDIYEDGKSNFIDKVFTQEEFDYCMSKKNPAPHFAVRFAAKEAVIKAYSAGKGINLLPNEIEIKRDTGAPSVRIKKDSHCQIVISMSHCSDKAIAIAYLTG